MATSQAVTMRRFVLVRQEDISGTSGTGVVAEGVEFSNGQSVLHWVTQLESVAVYASMKVLEQVHGHGGRTEIQWIDGKEKAESPLRPLDKSYSCQRCRDVGWIETGNNDLLCTCPAGLKLTYQNGQIVPRARG